MGALCAILVCCIVSCGTKQAKPEPPSVAREEIDSEFPSFDLPTADIYDYAIVVGVANICVW